MVPGPPDPHSPALGPSPPLRTEPRRPARDGRREALQGEREGRAAREPRVDREVRVCLVSAAMITTTTISSFPHNTLFPYTGRCGIEEACLECV